MAVNCPAFCGLCLGGNWRQYSQTIFVVVYAVISVVVLSLTIWVTVRFSEDSNVYFWFVAGVSVQLAICISLWNIFNHLIYYTKPTLQKYIVRIIGLIPAHSINCWMAIRYTDSAIYLDTIRNFYQAVVIYSFMALLLSYLHENYDDLGKVLACKPKIKSRPPCCCISAVPNSRLIGRFRAGVLTYTIIHPIITIIAIITEITGHYIEGSLAGIWIWLSIVDAVSQVWAMYCLMMFYRATKEELAGLRPIGKLVSVQLTIFGSFFQSLIINLTIGLINPTLNPEWGFENLQEFQRLIQDFVLCVEMSISAVAHLYTFPYTDYRHDGALPENCLRSCVACCSVTDIAGDVTSHVKRLYKKKSSLANQIEYEQYDDDNPPVELDDVSASAYNFSNVQEGVQNNQFTVVDDHATPTTKMETSDDHDDVDLGISDGSVRTVRHDSGSYSANGGENGHYDVADVVGSSITTVAVNEYENEPVIDQSQMTLGMSDDVDTVGEVDLGYRAQVIASIDGLPYHMEFDA